MIAPLEIFAKGVVGNTGNCTTGEKKRWAGLKSAERKLILRAQLPVYRLAELRKLFESFESTKLPC